MNKNSLIGIILIVGILIGWSVMNTPSKEQLAQQQHRRDSIARVQDSLNQLAAAQQLLEQQAEGAEPAEEVKKNYGAFNTAAYNGEEKTFMIENDVLRLTLSSKGAYVKTVELKDYKTWQGDSLIGFDRNSSRFNIMMVMPGSKEVGTSDLYFQPYVNGYPVEDQENFVVKNDSLVLSFRAYANDESGEYNLDKYIEFKYNVKKDEYMIGFDFETVNMKDIVSSTNNYLQVYWYADLLKQEKAIDRINGTNIYYKILNDDVESLSGDRSGDKNEEENVTKSLQWVSFKQRLFSYALISRDGFNSATLGMLTNYNKKIEIPNYLKSMYAYVKIPYQPFNDKNTIKMQYYFGPNSLKVFDKYDFDLDQQIPLGGKLVGWINRYIVVNVFNWLGSYGWSYGIVILILTIIIKLALMPFAFKSYKSTAKMRVLKPEIDEINARYPRKEDAMKKQQAMMDLYRKAGASPAAGCLPMLLQLPILWAVFRFFPASIELRQQSFLWADDLSTYDSILDLGFNIPFYGDHVSLFTLLMTVTTLLYTYINNKQMAATSGQNMKGMKIMMYAMPILFLGIFNDYSAGLSYYYMLVNIITFLQMYLFRVFMDDNKLRKKIELAKQKPVKKSRFQMKLEEMQKQQQQMQRRK